MRTENSVPQDHCFGSPGKASWCQTDTITIGTEFSIRTSNQCKIRIIPKNHPCFYHRYSVWSPFKDTNEPCHEIIMVLSVLSKLIFQTRMRSHLVGLDVWFLAGPFVYFHTSCVRTAKALARCAGSPEPSLVAYVLWAASCQNKQSDRAPSKDSDQPGHPPSLFRVFAVRSMGS